MKIPPDYEQLLTITVPINATISETKKNLFQSNEFHFKGESRTDYRLAVAFNEIFEDEEVTLIDSNTTLKQTVEQRKIVKLLLIKNSDKRNFENKHGSVHVNKLNSPSVSRRTNEIRAVLIGSHHNLSITPTEKPIIITEKIESQIKKTESVEKIDKIETPEKTEKNEIEIKIKENDEEIEKEMEKEKEKENLSEKGMMTVTEPIDITQSYNISQLSLSLPGRRGSGGNDEPWLQFSPTVSRSPKQPSLEKVDLLAGIITDPDRASTDEVISFQIPLPPLPSLQHPLIKHQRCRVIISP